jgi:hypothetical protein
MLTDYDLKDLAQKMDIPLEAILFKDELLKLPNLKYNRSYIINMENEFDEEGKPNSGSHWTCFQVNLYPNGKTEGCYFDSFGQSAPRAVAEFCGQDLPHSTKDIQSLMASCCGYYCLAYLHYINAFKHRTQDLYIDTENFLDMFYDLEKSCDWKHNEYVLKHFFQSSDPALRKPVSVEDAKRDDEVNGNVHAQVDVKYV